ncbi:transcription factor SPT20 homolog [Mizuhopecten yessoensis]|uniref:Transcription factor SPT20-like n=1 Tax=Mizuhopecten yessoensis TaxID=6573 RepID=A0A210Q641_MIZYE|nr:transcription factor SPT20 homolog [Mizuhopecten yessoensis]OWF44222.1 Transcription factor SPT20-like [Mizuhopecten yessoensis]
MEKLERDVEYAEYLIETAKQRPSQLLSKPISGNPKGKSIHQKLLELYIEETGAQPDDTDLVRATNLLPKLVRRDSLNCLILKLYPGNEGYSLMLRGRSGVESETFKLPYEVSELLEYIDSSELPPFLVDLLERAQVNVFYSGCVIVEVRDYRRSANGGYDTQYVLLKPSQQSLLSDIYNLSSDGHRWTPDDLLTLESQLILATEDPICLDPSPSVLLVANRQQYDKKKFNTPLLKRSVKKYTQAAINRKRKFAQAAAPKELRLLDFLQKKKSRTHTPNVNLKIGKPPVDMWQQRLVQLSVPETVDVEKYATAQEPPEMTPNNVLELVEETTLERDINTEKKLLARLSIRKRKSDDMYFGTLYLDHDYKENSRGKTCTFNLRTKSVVDKYLQQFKEIFTEEGRRAVKITTQKPGHAPHIEYTQTTLTTSTPGITITAAQALMSRQAVTATLTTAQPDPQSGTTAAGLLAGKRNVPIQLSLTIAPAAPGSTSQAPNQLQLNIQKQPTSHQSQTLSRTKLGHHGIGQRSIPNTPDQSPASTPTSTGQGQLFPQGPTSVTSVHSVKTPIPTPTPPPNTTLTNLNLQGRKPGIDNSNITQIQQSLQQAGNITFVQTTEGNTGQATLNQQPITNINIANIGLPSNLLQNLTGLQGMNITNLQGLQNMQVSLSVPGGGSIPVPLSLINTNAGVIQNHTGIFVSSLPSGIVSSSTSTSSPIVSSASLAQTSSSGASVPTMVTMVTAISSVTHHGSTTNTTTVASSGGRTSGIANNPASVLPPAGMLSLPLGSIGLGPFMSGIKQQAGSNIRAPTTLPLLQIQGQHGGIQLLGLQQQRAPLKTGTSNLASQPAGQQLGGTKVAVSIPTTGVLSAQSLAGHQVATLSQLKPGQAPGGTLQPQQLMQLQATQLTFNKQQPLQLHPIQLKPQQPQQIVPGGINKSKSKKRTTPTPPKH